MKTTLFALCLLFATAALGQSADTALSSEPQVFRLSGHPEHATQQPLGQEQSLLENSSYTYAQGERPLWEVSPLSHTTPLGDTARILRKEHEMAKKADIVWSN